MPSSKFLQRIDRFCQNRHISHSQLAQKLQLDPEIFEQVASGQEDQAILLITRMNRAFDISLDELLYQGFEAYYPREDSSLVPVVNVTAFADYLERHEDAEYIRNLDYYRIPGYDNGDFRIFEVDGDSMSPTIENGDHVICRKSEGEIDSNNLYVVVSSRGIVVKRLFHLEKADKESFVLRSDNDEFEDMTLKTEEVLELWRVEGKITRKFISDSLEQNQQIERLEQDLLEVKENINSLMDRNSSDS